MSHRCRQHVNPLKMAHLVPRKRALSLPSPATIEVELGCGDGRFLLSRAQSFPHRFFIGLDIRQAFLAIPAAEIQRLGLTNIQLHVSNLLVDAERLFLPGQVHRFYINFPDPWFKHRQHNRRWLNEDSLSALVTALTENGEIFFQSDVWSLALDALALLEKNVQLVNTCGEWSFLRHNPYHVRSSREIACQAIHRPIWRLLFSRLLALD